MTTETRPLSRALDLLSAGQWQPTHEIVQKQDSPLAAWLHGIVHILEGDLKPTAPSQGRTPSRARSRRRARR